MKEIKTIKFETSDGTRFEDKRKAQKHEFRITAETPNEDGAEASRLTIVALIDAMFENPDPFINMLTEVKAENLRDAVPDAEAAE